MTLLENDPREIGGYRLEGRIGAGGMGVVYRARSLSGRQVALKVIRPELAGDEEFRARFRHEVEAARRVSGAFTAPVVDADPDAPSPWLATLYVQGPSLAERVARQGPLSPPEVRRLATGLAEALRDIHRAGLVHRDLKPGNVLLAEDGPRVIDFGIARALDGTQLTSTGVAVGTPPFMAPEQFRHGDTSPATDVFALGSVLAFAGTGRGPFGADSSHAVGFRVVYEEPDLAGLAAELLPMVAACLAKEPTRRPTLETLLTWSVAGVEPPPTAPGTRPPAAPETRPATVWERPVAPPVPTEPDVRPAPLAPALPPPAGPAVIPAPTDPAVPTPAASRPRRRKAALVVAVAVALAAAGGTTVLLRQQAKDSGGAGALPPAASAPSTPGQSGRSGPPDCPSARAVVGGDGPLKTVMSRWTADYHQACPTANVATTDLGGTADQQFVAGQVDAVTLDDAPLGDEAAGLGKRCTAARPAKLPLAALPIAVVYNVPGLDSLVLDAPTVARIFNGQITSWRDPAIATLNPGRMLPDSAVTAVHPSAESPVTLGFTRYLAEAAPAAWPYPAAARSWPAQAAGGLAVGDPGAVRQTVTGKSGAIAFLPLKDAGGLRTAKLSAGSGPVAATTEAATAALAGAKVTGTGADLTVDVDHANPGSGAYPLVQVGYAVFCGTDAPDNRGNRPTQALAGLLSHAVSAAGRPAATQLGYAALPPALARQVTDALNGLTAG
ncbi:substrate-binding domain-containing protein [Kitasatospora sp. NBC_01300]|uniref:serine/threonine-protein kinase n=1 Tax=Kitasatospora sp. NBC_01300 TaxID=2903574 RepID=UPI00352E4997|nr:substrate-binding domain-containing protein [Kitasatospora sp. NBC_01300]